MAREPREQLVLDLLRDNWDDSNTFGLTPNIRYGWFDDEGDTPQVTIPRPDEGPDGGGQTGYTGVAGDGSGDLHQDVIGTLDVSVWCSFKQLENASTDHPREWIGGSTDRNSGDTTHGAVEEIKDIIRENGNVPTNPDTGNEPVWAMSPGTSAPIPEPDERGLFRENLPINFVYHTGNDGDN